MPPKHGRRRAWNVWALGDGVAVVGFLGVIATSSSPVLSVLSWITAAAGIVLIFAGAAGDRR